MVAPDDGGFVHHFWPYGWPMKTQIPVAPRTATLDHDLSMSARRAPRTRRIALIASAGFALAIAFGACNTPAGSTIPGTSIVAPSIDASAAASLGSQAALAALDQVDAAITANTSASGLTAADTSALTQLTAALRTSLQSGDMTAARTAVTDLATKVDGLASKLSGPAGIQLTSTIAALKAAVGA